ncbi:DNA mismatch repair protein MutS [Pedobacter sp. HMF7647]|uniref:DNA mismatch repair protein MutS n=1 Tax=Hufsiella arboris TaxID=2695275 RepID=A0A7K1Y4L1_9SPHI|nr:Smr/MutS family protein [Hufsiella arboris]MXV49517.1 DNA mismatch repair protein MutS [Hufsiella arboris]
MKFQLGEFVRFVEEKYEGIITKIISDDMVGVTGDDDFEIPVQVSKITYVHGREPDRKEVHETTDETPQSGEFKTHGIQLAVVPDLSKSSAVTFFVINQTSWQLLLSLSTEKNHQYKGEYAGLLGPRSATKIYAANLGEIELWPSFIFSALYFTKQSVAPLKPLQLTKKFKGKDFSGSKSKTDIINQQAWIIEMDEPEPKIDPEKLKESFFKPTTEKQQIEKPSKEVDLHIEKLRDDHQFLSNRQILEVQIKQFQTSLDAAIVHKLPSIIFIHGTGNGTLKQEIHKALGKHQQVKTFMDARKEKFGYGATEVMLK